MPEPIEPTKPEIKPTITLIHRCCSDGVKLYQQTMKKYPELVGIKVKKINLLNSIEQNLHKKYCYMPSDLHKISVLIINRDGIEEVLRGDNK